MNEQELKALCNGLIAYCQRHSRLSTNSDMLAEQLQALASDELNIPISTIIDYLE